MNTEGFVMFMEIVLPVVLITIVVMGLLSGCNFPRWPG